MALTEIEAFATSWCMEDIKETWRVWLGFGTGVQV
jgi:hypothetical protein